MCIKNCVMSITIRISSTLVYVSKIQGKTPSSLPHSLPFSMKPVIAMFDTEWGNTETAPSSSPPFFYSQKLPQQYYIRYNLITFLHSDV